MNINSPIANIKTFISEIPKIDLGNFGDRAVTFIKDNALLLGIGYYKSCIGTFCYFRSQPDDKPGVEEITFFSDYIDEINNKKKTDLYDDIFFDGIDDHYTPHRLIKRIDDQYTPHRLIKRIDDHNISHRSIKRNRPYFNAEISFHEIFNDEIIYHDIDIDPEISLATKLWEGKFYECKFLIEKIERVKFQKKIIPLLLLANQKDETSAFATLPKEIINSIGMLGRSLTINSPSLFIKILPKIL